MRIAPRCFAGGEVKIKLTGGNRVRKVKRVAAVVLIGCLGLLALNMTRSAGNRTVVVGIEQVDYFPVLNAEHGEVSGFAREVFDLFGRRYGYTIQYRILPIPQLYKALLAEQSVDLKFPDNPVWMSALRKSKSLHYSNGVLDFVDGVMVRPDRLGGHLDALHRLGAIQGFDVSSYYERVQSGRIRMVQANELSTLLDEGLRGQVDGVFGNVAIAAARLRQQGHPGALLYDPALPHNDSSYLVSSLKRPDLIRSFNAFLVKNKAEIDALKRKYDIEPVQGVGSAALVAGSTLPVLPGGNDKLPLLTLCHDALPPFAIGNGEWITDGIKFRLMRDVLSEAGIRMRVLQLPWTRCQAEAAIGRVDGILPTFKTPERESKFVFSEPVLNQELAFFYLRKQFSPALEWSSYDDLRGNRLGMLLGGVIDPVMEKTLASGGMLVRGNDAETLMKMLQHQRLDLVALDRQVGLYEMGVLGLDKEIRVSSQLINRRPAMLALSRNSKQVALMPRINQAIERMAAAGRLSR